MTRGSFLSPSLPLFHQLNFLKTSHIFKLDMTKLMLTPDKSLDTPQFHSIKLVTAQHNCTTLGIPLKIII